MRDRLNKIDELNKLAWDSRRTDIQQSFALGEEALQLSQEANYKKGLAESHKVIGYACWQLADYTKALEASMQAMYLFRELNDKSGEADTISTIGAVYAFTGEDEKRLKFNLDCLRLRKETIMPDGQIGDKEGEIMARNNIGDTYMKLGQMDKALDMFFECEKIPRKDDRVIAMIYLNIGEVYLKQNKPDEAQNYLNKCILISEEHYLIRVLIGGLFLLGELNLTKCNFELSIGFLNRALALAMDNNSKEYIYEINHLLATVYEKNNSIDKAYEHFKIYHKIKEEVFKDNNNQHIKNLQFKHQIDDFQKTAEIEQLKNVELKKALSEIESQKNEIVKTNKNITDSIIYAKRIQKAILTADNYLKKHLPDYFVLYIPKDIVSGDFYWVFETRDKKVLVATADCTGHGVPGAFMSMIGSSKLNEIVNERKLSAPNVILNQLRTEVIKAMNPEDAEEVSQDGMDIALCCFDFKTGMMEYSGANNPIYIIGRANDEDDSFKLTEYKADKLPIGKHIGEQNPFTLQTIQLNKGDTVYSFTDGYADQFGGEKQKKFKYKQLQELLLSIQDKTMSEQKAILDKTIESWKGNIEQVDDILIIGVRI